MWTTTLNQIRKRHPCANGWKKLLKHLGKTEADDKPLSLLTILESNGLDDALWCLRTISGHDDEIRAFATWCARRGRVEGTGDYAAWASASFAAWAAVRNAGIAAADAARDAARAAERSTQEEYFRKMVGGK